MLVAGGGCTSSGPPQSREVCLPSWIAGGVEGFGSPLLATGCALFVQRDDAVVAWTLANRMICQRVSRCDESFYWYEMTTC